MENNKDYIFYINWEDKMKNMRKVGYFAHLNKYFYLLISGEGNSKTAYENGFVGIPGFKVDNIYRSPQLFEFFKNRILNKNSENPCQELLENEGKSMIDSISLEIVPESLANKHIESLLDAYRIQEEKKKIQEVRKSGETAIAL